MVTHEPPSSALARLHEPPISSNDESRTVVVPMPGRDVAESPLPLSVTSMATESGAGCLTSTTMDVAPP